MSSPSRRATGSPSIRTRCSRTEAATRGRARTCRALRRHAAPRRRTARRSDVVARCGPARATRSRHRGLRRQFLRLRRHRSPARHRSHLGPASASPDHPRHSRGRPCLRCHHRRWRRCPAPVPPVPEDTSTFRSTLETSPTMPPLPVPLALPNASAIAPALATVGRPPAFPARACPRLLPRGTGSAALAGPGAGVRTTSPVLTRRRFRKRLERVERHRDGSLVTSQQLHGHRLRSEIHDEQPRDAERERERVGAEQRTAFLAGDLVAQRATRGPHRARLARTAAFGPHVSSGRRASLISARPHRRRPRDSPAASGCGIRRAAPSA